jgi:hypothetical protein
VITVSVKTPNQVTLEEFLKNGATYHVVVIDQKLVVAYGEMLYTVLKIRTILSKSFIY